MRPESIKIHRKSADLELVYREALFDYRRIFASTLAFGRGQGHGQVKPSFSMGSATFNSMTSRPWGYAIRIIFSDGHDTGIYSWPYLRQLCDNHEETG